MKAEVVLTVFLNLAGLAFQFMNLPDDQMGILVLVVFLDQKAVMSHVWKTRYIHIWHIQNRILYDHNA